MSPKTANLATLVEMRLTKGDITITPYAAENGLWGYEIRNREHSLLVSEPEFRDKANSMEEANKYLERVMGPTFYRDSLNYQIA